MCTVSWVTEAQGYTLFQNRDESRTRASERPPTLETLSGVRYIAPTDGACDGTWILVNECGLTVTLLNAYRASLGAPRESYETRGALVRGLADCIDARACRARLDELDLDRYQPFTLLVVHPDGSFVLDWDGLERTFGEAAPRMPLCSSGKDARLAREVRNRTLDALVKERGQLDAALLWDFHQSHAEGPSAASTCMHREEAETRSATRISVTAERIVLEYWNDAPCRARSSSTFELAPRAREARA